LFSSVKAVAIGWLASGVILLATRRFMNGSRPDLSMKDALILGFTQGIAIIPGVSRSGITISTLLFRNIDKIVGFSFSFLVSIPVIFGATLLEAKDINFAFQGAPAALITGFLCSFFTGLAALLLLKRMITQKYFYLFGYYCIVLGLVVIFFIK